MLNPNGRPSTRPEAEPQYQVLSKVQTPRPQSRPPKALPGESVRLPGDARAKRRADRLANGLALPPELLVQLDKLAGELAIKPLKAR